mgnify:CR=1 FL=1
MQIFKGANILKTGKRSEGHVLTEKYKNFIFLGFLFSTFNIWSLIPDFVKNCIF